MKKEAFPLDRAPRLVQKFVKAHERSAESADEFLAAAVLFVASVIAGRWVDVDGLALNNYFLIVGRTGTARKSTAQATAQKLLTRVVGGIPSLIYQSQARAEEEEKVDGPREAYPLVTHFSAEGLQQCMGTGTSAALVVGEYKAIFDVAGRSSQKNTVTELTNMYDGSPVSVRTLSRIFRAEQYALSILGSSTSSWLGDFGTGQNIGGGFVNRHLLITGQPNRVIPRPRAPDAALMDEVVTGIRKLVPHDLKPIVEGGQIRWEGTRRSLGWEMGVELAWDRYYEMQTLACRGLDSDILAELSARETTHAKKLAGLAAFLDGSCAIGRQHLEFGARLARWSIQNSIELMAADYKPDSKGEEIVLAKLKKSGPMNRRDLQQLVGGNHGDGFSFSKTILVLEAKGVLEERPDGILHVPGAGSNIQQEEIRKYFGESNISEVLQLLDVGETAARVGAQ